MLKKKNEKGFRCSKENHNNLVYTHISKDRKTLLCPICVDEPKYKGCTSMHGVKEEIIKEIPLSTQKNNTQVQDRTTSDNEFFHEILTSKFDMNLVRKAIEPAEKIIKEISKAILVQCENFTQDFEPELFHIKLLQEAEKMQDIKNRFNTWREQLESATDNESLSFSFSEYSKALEWKKQMDAYIETGGEVIELQKIKSEYEKKVTKLRNTLSKIKEFSDEYSSKVYNYLNENGLISGSIKSHGKKNKNSSEIIEDKKSPKDKKSTKDKKSPKDMKPPKEKKSKISKEIKKEENDEDEKDSIEITSIEAESVYYKKNEDEKEIKSLSSKKKKATSKSDSQEENTKPIDGQKDGNSGFKIIPEEVKLEGNDLISYLDQSHTQLILFSPSMNLTKKIPFDGSVLTQAESILINQVLVICGGKNSVSMEEPFTYEVDFTKKPYKCVQKGDMNTGRYDHALVPTPKYLVAIGGINDSEFLSEVEGYNYKDGCWKTFSEMDVAVGNAGACYIPERARLYVFGGRTIGGSSVDICYLDFESDEPEDSWTTIETALDESWGLVSAVYYSPTPKTKKILIFGGMMKAQVYSLNLESQKIEEESSLFLPFVTGTLIRNSCKTLPNGVYGISKESCSLALLQNGVWKQYSQREWAQTDLVYDATSAIP